MILYFIRHGDPIYETNSLTEIGKKQADALAKRLSLYGLDEIYSSTSQRAILTATPTSKILNKEIKYLDWTNEDYTWRELTVKKGDGITWLGQSEEYIDKLNSKEVKELGFEWYKHEYFKDYNFEEGIKRVEREADAFLESLGYKHNRTISGYQAINPNNKKIALFAHQGFGWAFLASILDIPYPYFATHFDLGHSSVTVIHFNDKGINDSIVYPVVLQLSNDSHLYKEDILTGYQNKIDI